jgi:hypothetical protein
MSRFRLTALALALGAATALGGCARSAPAGPQVGPPTAQSDAARNGMVEVFNRTTAPVVLFYLRQGGGPYLLGTVQAGDRQRIALPEEDVRHIYAETQDGQHRYDNQPDLVRIRRLAPGSRVGRVR